jgi:hypothetical protein
MLHFPLDFCFIELQNDPRHALREPEIPDLTGFKGECNVMAGLPESWRKRWLRADL